MQDRWGNPIYDASQISQRAFGDQMEIVDKFRRFANNPNGSEQMSMEEQKRAIDLALAMGIDLSADVSMMKEKIDPFRNYTKGALSGASFGISDIIWNLLDKNKYITDEEQQNKAAIFGGLASMAIPGFGLYKGLKLASQLRNASLMQKTAKEALLLEEGVKRSQLSGKKLTSLAKFLNKEEKDLVLNNVKNPEFKTWATGVSKERDAYLLSKTKNPEYKAWVDKFRAEGDAYFKSGVIIDGKSVKQVRKEYVTHMKNFLANNKRPKSLINNTIADPEYKKLMSSYLGKKPNPGYYMPEKLTRTELSKMSPEQISELFNKTFILPQAGSIGSGVGGFITGFSPVRNSAMNIFGGQGVGGAGGVMGALYGASLFANPLVRGLQSETQPSVASQFNQIPYMPYSQPQINTQYIPPEYLQTPQWGR